MSASFPTSLASCRSADAIRQAVERALEGRVSAGFAQYSTSDFDRVPCGIAALNDLTGGLPRGALTEICGPASSGRTTALIAALAHATSNGEVCCLVDVTDSFDPRSAATAGAELSRILWVRCGRSHRSSAVGHQEELPNCQTAELPSRLAGSPRRRGDAEKKEKQKDKEPWPMANGQRPTANGSPTNKHFGNSAVRQFGNFYNQGPNDGLFETIQKSKVESQNFGDGQWPTANGSLTNDRRLSALEQALKVTDLVLQGGGFGLVAVDMGDIAPQIARRVPLTSWFRFRRAVEKTRTVLLVLEQEPNAGTCASLVLQLTRKKIMEARPSIISHAQLLCEIDIQAEAVRLPGRKQPQHAHTCFRAESQWKIG